MNFGSPAWRMDIFHLAEMTLYGSTTLLTTAYADMKATKSFISGATKKA
jgi:hypothetical protein